MKRNVLGLMQLGYAIVSGIVSCRIPVCSKLAIMPDIKLTVILVPS